MFSEKIELINNFIIKLVRLVEGFCHLIACLTLVIRKLTCSFLTYRSFFFLLYLNIFCLSRCDVYKLKFEGKTFYVFGAQKEVTFNIFTEFLYLI